MGDPSLMEAILGWATSIAAIIYVRKLVNRNRLN
jgi:hypothetical protein